MIKKADIERLPTALRDTIRSHLREQMDRAHEASYASALVYSMTKDEKQRSDALISRGAYEAYHSILKIFD